MKDRPRAGRSFPRTLLYLRRAIDFLDRHFVVALFLGYVVLHALYHKIPVDGGAPYWGTENHNIAASLVQGKGFADPYTPLETGPTSWVSPPFPYLLAAVFWVAGTKTPAAARLAIVLQGLLFAGTLWLLYSIARRTFSTSCAKLAALTWLISPNRIGLTSTHLSEVGFSALSLLLAITAFLHCQESPTRRAAALTGLAIGFAVLCLPVMALALPFFAYGLYVVSRRRTTHAWTGPVIALTLCFAVLAPWMTRNYITFRAFVFIKSNLGVILFFTNRDDSRDTYASLREYPSKRELERERHLMQRMGEIPYERYSLKRATAWIRTHPGEYVVKSVKRALVLWVANPAAGWKRWVWNLYQILLLTTGALGLRAHWRRCPTTVLCVAILITVPFIYYVTSVLDPHRLRLPFEPLLILFGSAVTVNAFEK
jgi:4-amino-4-deoxy-L-arabinose transferase-like glycosyltransferase